MAFSFYFRLHRRTSWLFSPVSFLCQAKPFFYIMVRNQFAFSIYSIFLYEGKFVHRIFAAITFQLFATLAEVFTFLFIKLFPVETSEKLLEIQLSAQSYRNYFYSFSL